MPLPEPGSALLACHRVSWPIALDFLNMIPSFDFTVIWSVEMAMGHTDLQKRMA
jgi:hypothetical protein